MLLEEITQIFLDAGLGEVEEIHLIAGSRNENFKVIAGGKQYFLKHYNMDSGGQSNGEVFAFFRLKGSPYIKQVHAIGEDYLITEFSEGELLQFFPLDNHLEVNYIALQVVSFIKHCLSFEGVKFGRVLPSGEAPYESWSECLLTYNQSLIKKTVNLPVEYKEILEPKLQQLMQIFKSNLAHLNSIKGRFVPVDLNLSNFVIQDKFRLLMTDLESFWYGDPLLAYGDWMGNTYGTILYDAFSSHWGELTGIEKMMSHAYAILSNLSALIFIAQHSDNKLAEAKPWGNSSTYYELIAQHEKQITEMTKAIADREINHLAHTSVRNSAEHKPANLLGWAHTHARISDIILQIRRFVNIEFKRDPKEPFYVLIYGSYAYKLAQPTSDLDVIFVTEKVDKSRIDRIIIFVETLHKKYGMRRDDEIPYEFKVAFSVDFVNQASSGEGIINEAEEWHFPSIVKDRDYLTSKPLLSRFLLGMLANPHLFIDGDFELYQKHRFSATANLIKAIATLNDLKKISAISLLEYFCKNTSNESGDFFLGFTYKEPFKSYLQEYLETVLSRMKESTEFSSKGAIYEFTDEELSTRNRSCPLSQEKNHPKEITPVRSRSASI
jgi:predicted nucleotidyltransferase